LKINYFEEKPVVKIFVKTRRVAVRSITLESSVMTTLGPVKLSRRAVQYENQLDDVQQRMLDEASDLAASAGLKLEVVDVSKLNILQQLGRQIFRNDYKPPVVVLPNAVLARVRKHTPSDKMEDPQSSFSSPFLEPKIFQRRGKFERKKMTR